MADDSIFGSVLGMDALPPSPLMPIQTLLDPNALPAAVSTGPDIAAQPASSAAMADQNKGYGAIGTDSSADAGLNVPVGPAGQPAPAQIVPPTAPGQAGAWGGNLPPFLNHAFNSLASPQADSGIFGPNTGRFMAGLGAGLQSVGQNWNKPGGAAFAASAGSAIQGGQAYANQQQDQKLKLVQAAIHAWQLGDMEMYRRAILGLQTLKANDLSQYRQGQLDMRRQGLGIQPPQLQPQGPPQMRPGAGPATPAGAVAPAVISMPGNGTRENPYAPRNAADYGDAVMGSYVIHPNIGLTVKGPTTPLPQFAGAAPLANLMGAGQAPSPATSPSVSSTTAGPSVPAGTAAFPAQAAPVADTPAAAVLPPAANREIGKVYRTPRGPARWMGNGWQLEQS
jgi:hypothetical protein